MASAFATLIRLDELLFIALIEAAQRHVGKFNAQDLANTALALAMTKKRDAGLFAAMMLVAGQIMVCFKAQELANTAWACATLAWSD